MPQTKQECLYASILTLSAILFCCEYLGVTNYVPYHYIILLILIQLTY